MRVGEKFVFVSSLITAVKTTEALTPLSKHIHHLPVLKKPSNLFIKQYDRIVSNILKKLR